MLSHFCSGKNVTAQNCDSGAPPRVTAVTVAASTPAHPRFSDVATYRPWLRLAATALWGSSTTARDCGHRPAEARGRPVQQVGRQPGPQPRHSGPGSGSEPQWPVEDSERAPRLRTVAVAELGGARQGEVGGVCRGHCAAAHHIDLGQGSGDHCSPLALYI